MRYTDEEWFDLPLHLKVEHDRQLFHEVLERLGPDAPDGEFRREFERLRPKDPVIHEIVPMEELP